MVTENCTMKLKVLRAYIKCEYKKLGNRIIWVAQFFDKKFMEHQLSFCWYAMLSKSFAMFLQCSVMLVYAYIKREFQQSEQLDYISCPW